jgi:hypothetical protein
LVNILNDVRRCSRMQDEGSKEQHMRWSTTRRVGSLRIENYDGGGGEYEE